MASRSPRRSRPQTQNQAPELATVVRDDDLRPSTSAGTGVNDGEASEQTSPVRDVSPAQRIVAEATEAQFGMMPTWSWAQAAQGMHRLTVREWVLVNAGCGPASNDAGP
jgi:hypothetical protein